MPPGFEFEVLGDRERGNPRKTGCPLGRRRTRRLDQAVAAFKEGRADAVVTGPVSKDGLQALGFPFPGQTEYFAHAFGVQDFGMLLTGNTLTVGLATIHEALAAVPSLLSVGRITRIGMLTAGISQAPWNRPSRASPSPDSIPTQVKTALSETRKPASSCPPSSILNESGTATFTGPAVPDAIFRDAAQGHFDAVIAMYHDQGLIPLKLLDFDNAVNVTLGLPKPRTSPDHGTAFAIAGQRSRRPLVDDLRHPAGLRTRVKREHALVI